jgi:hypothetical protein
MQTAGYTLVNGDHFIEGPSSWADLTFHHPSDWPMDRIALRCRQIMFENIPGRMDAKVVHQLQQRVGRIGNRHCIPATMRVTGHHVHLITTPSLVPLRASATVIAHNVLVLHYCCGLRVGFSTRKVLRPLSDVAPFLIDLRRATGLGATLSHWPTFTGEPTSTFQICFYAG